MDWLFFIEFAFGPWLRRALLALTGIAFVLIYKATKVLNLAVGEMLMLCAYFFVGMFSALALPVWA
jgi:branched-chain amino acid transport system permease protein